MDEIYSRIKIIPLNKCLSHEGIVQKWVDQIAANIKTDGTMKNPIIVTKYGDRYIVLDGMHRFAALKQLEIRDIMACEVDYLSGEIILEGWDIFTFKKIGAANLLEELFPQSGGYQFTKVKNLAHAKDSVLKRKGLLAIGDKGGGIFLLRKEKAKGDLFLENLCAATDKLDRVISERFAKAIYVDNSLTLTNFAASSAASVVFRPQFTKREVIDRTLHQKPFPPKSTRHLIPKRPLRVDLNLSHLRAKIDLKTKNELLKDHLQWCYENNRVRFYPESVYIFAD